MRPAHLWGTHQDPHSEEGFPKAPSRLENGIWRAWLLSRKVFMPLLAVSTVSHLRTPAGVRAAPKLGPEPKKPQQHIGTREHPEPRGETALRGRETRQLGFRPSKREIEGEQRHVLETHRHRWHVIPTCESERSVYTCGVARRTASLGSGNSFHHRVPGTPTIAATPARPRLSSCAESLHKSKCRPQPAPRLQTRLGRPLPSRTC